MTHRLIPLLLLAAACGSRPAEPTTPRPRLSAVQHMQEARRHDAMADTHEQRAREYDQERLAAGAGPIDCIDDPLEGVTYSGGERISVPRPCWTAITSPSARERREAQRHRELAQWHREQAGDLWRAERAACAGLGEGEISQGPFAQRRDVLRVAAHRPGGELRGAVVVFRAVPGLTVDFMTRSLRCNHARAAVLGFRPTFMSYSPVALPGVTTSVRALDGEIEVTVSSERADVATSVLARAEALLEPPAAPTTTPSDPPTR